MITLFLCLVSWLPTVNGQRADFGPYPPPFYLGVSIPPYEEVRVEAWLEGKRLFEVNQGTFWNLAYVQRGEVEFFEDGAYAGTIVPEPTVFILLLSGMIWRRKWTN